MKINMAHLTQIERGLTERFKYRIEVDESSSNFKVTFSDRYTGDIVADVLDKEDLVRIANDLKLIAGEGYD